MGEAIIERRVFFFFPRKSVFVFFFFSKKDRERKRERKRERRKQAICLFVLNPKGLA